MPVSPDQQTPTIHVEDLVHAYLAVVERRDDPAVKGQIFNIVNPIPERRKDMIDAVVRFTGFKGELLFAWARSRMR